MAISKRTVILDLLIEPDGRVTVFEQTEYWEGGFANGVKEATGPRTGRVIDVGDNVSTESDLIKDVVNGNLHSAARKTARQTAIDAEDQ